MSGMQSLDFWGVGSRYLGKPKSLISAFFQLLFSGIPGGVPVHWNQGIDN